MKRIALFALLSALVGNSVAFAADPCGCKGCKPAAQENISPETDTRSTHEREFNLTDLSHMW